jgi:hypothetical protein
MLRGTVVDITFFGQAHYRVTLTAVDITILLQNDKLF